MNSIGTRSRNLSLSNAPYSGTIGEGYTRDVTMSKLVSGASLTFTASTGRVSGSNGTFTAFAVNDLVFFSGTNLNQGEHIVTAVDGVNAAYCVLSPAPKDEGPLTATMRTV